MEKRRFQLNAELKSAPVEDIPNTSKNRICRFYADALSSEGERKALVREYLNDALNREYDDYESLKDFNKANPEYVDQLFSGLSYTEQETLKRYTGFNYRAWNTYLRKGWIYDEHGAYNEARKRDYEEDIAKMDKLIESSPKAESDFYAYRGVNIEAFRDYGVQTVEELSKLKGQFYLERGFTSTAISLDQSFIGREEFDDVRRKPCNVGIRYMIPKGTNEGVVIPRGSLSYSHSTDEYVLHSSALSYIDNVEVSEDGESAAVSCVVIPREYYDLPLSELKARLGLD
jgi:tetratricopeptide (TPR) repeat protein